MLNQSRNIFRHGPSGRAIGGMGLHGSERANLNLQHLLGRNGAIGLALQSALAGLFRKTNGELQTGHGRMLAKTARVGQFCFWLFFLLMSQSMSEWMFKPMLVML